jgi:cell division protein FtsZ
MGGEVRVTVIAAGFDRWDQKGADRSSAARDSGAGRDVFGGDEDGGEGGDDDDFDVPSFLK